MKNCTYCKAFDHTVEQCLYLIAKWQARTVVDPKPVQNLNLNPNINIQMISVKPRQPNLVVVTRGGATTGAEQNTQQGKW